MFFCGIAILLLNNFTELNSRRLFTPTTFLCYFTVPLIWHLLGYCSRINLREIRLVINIIRKFDEFLTNLLTGSEAKESEGET